MNKYYLIITESIEENIPNSFEYGVIDEFNEAPKFSIIFENEKELMIYLNKYN